jgi:enamine deaminase RidA (YjgF/YER057c/UK114 family)
MSGYPVEDSRGYARAICVGDHVFVSGTTGPSSSPRRGCVHADIRRNRDGQGAARRIVADIEPEAAVQRALNQSTKLVTVLRGGVREMM